MLACTSDHERSMPLLAKLRDFFTHAGYRRYIGRIVARKVGYRIDHWIRVVCIDEWKAYLASLPLPTLSALEISPANVSHWRDAGFARYRAVQFPEFDIIKDRLDEKFDVIIADNVFEHLRDPYQAARNVAAMLSDKGVFLLATPFLIRVHGFPGDFTRWTPEGLKAFLEDCGFESEIRSWGNRKAVSANLADWRCYGWGLRTSLRNEPNFPAMVWAYARHANGPPVGALPSD
jgi:SAM-dependent methyltransferase